MHPNFRDSISDFQKSYRSFGISVTQKVNTVFEHVARFLELKGLKTGLGAWSEQAMESVYHNLKLEWEMPMTLKCWIYHIS